VTGVSFMGLGLYALYYHTEIKISKESNVGKNKRHIPPRPSHTPQSPHPLYSTNSAPPPIPSHPTTQANPPPPQHPTPPPPKQTLNKLTRPVPKNQKHGQNKKGTQSPPPPIRRGKRKRHETIKLGYSR